MASWIAQTELRDYMVSFAAPLDDPDIQELIRLLKRLEESGKVGLDPDDWEERCGED